MFPHSVSTRQDSCVRIYTPLKPSEGAFELTHGSACIIEWSSGLPDSLISTYIAQFMGFVLGRIRYELKVVFCFIHITAFHYHHCARQLTGTEYISMFVEYLVEVCLTCCQSYRLLFIFIAIYGVVCVQLAHFSIGDWKDISVALVIIIINSEVSIFPIVIIFPWFCAWDVCCIIFCDSWHIRNGKTGNLLSPLLCRLWWVQIVGYVLPCRSYSFVCTVHHHIIIIVQNYLKT